MAKVNITSPVGRIVQGSLYEPSRTDQLGNPLVVKTGANMGQPRVDYWFKLAIPKGSEPHWAHTPWGQQIWNIGNRAFPNYAQTPRFSWKIEDGDDATPNPERKGRKNCDTEGFRGHWIIKFSGGFAPKVYQQEGAGYVQVMQKDFCKPGYFVEVAMSVDGNGNDSKPGVYLNHSMVCFRAYGPEISFGPDVASAGFGQSALPAGASMTPPAGAIPMPQAPAAAPALPGAPVGYAPPPVPAGVPQMPGVPGAPLAPASAAYAPPAGVPQVPGAPVGSYATTAYPSSPAPIPVTPNPGFVQVPPPAPAPMAPPPAPSIPVRQMTAAANGVTYDAYVAAGWSDVQLVQNGMMLA